MHPLLHLLLSDPGSGGGITLNPDPSTLPGTPELQKLANGLGFWALIAALIGIVIGGVVWAFGHYSQNYQQSMNGRKGVLVCLLAALLVGAAPHLVNFLLSQGNTVANS